MKPNNAQSVQLHGFADASEKAHGSCLFLRWQLEDGSWKCTFVAAKANVTPVKAQTIPRYELMGCTLLSRLTKNVLNAMRYEIENVVLWTNGTTVLSWIHSNSKDFKSFVQVRVDEIRRTFDPEIWRCVPSLLNLADKLSKGTLCTQDSRSRRLDEGSHIFKKQ